MVNRNQIFLIDELAFVIKVDIVHFMIRLVLQNEDVDIILCFQSETRILKNESICFKLQVLRAKLWHFD